LIFLHNYFIMHGIKYFFLNKNNQTIQRGRGKKNFQGGTCRKHYRKTLFFKIQEGTCPPWINLGPPLPKLKTLRALSTFKFCKLQFYPWHAVTVWNILLTVLPLKSLYFLFFMHQPLKIILFHLSWAICSSQIPGTFNK
jgi:hypothetical protein